MLKNIMSTNINMRKKRFIQDLLNHHAKLPDGGWMHRKKVKVILYGLANDLAYLDILPMRLKNLDPDKIIDLVKYWHKLGRQPRTIVNKLGALRRVLSTLEQPIEIPSNRELGVIIVNQKPKLYRKCELIQPEEVQLFPAFIVKEICLFQYLFGLKLDEAVQFNASMIQKKYVSIPRSISFNKKDRRVVICSEAQRKFLEKFEANLRDILPLSKYGYQCFLILYQYAQKQMKIPNRDYFRHQYIQNRYQELLEKEGHFEALDTIKAEVGYSRISQIRRVLSCQESS